MLSDINIKIDHLKCLGCGDCVERCILDNLRLWVPPCRAACPIYKNCQGYIKYIALGKELDAAKHMNEFTPFSNILSRVCTHPCESACLRAEQDGQSVNIRGLKRYLSDTYEDIILSIPEMSKDNGFRVGIIGSGPAGMSAAFELRKKGYHVEVLDREQVPGGMLRWGIPSFRLPEVEVDKCIKLLEKMGVQFHCNSSIDLKDGLRELKKTYDAIIVAAGAGKSKKLNMAGLSTSNQVFYGLDLLKAVKLGKLPNIGKSVIILGGGNSAVDSAIVCRRLGIEQIQIVCLEDANEMPAFATELTQAHEEGIGIVNGYGIQSAVTKSDGTLHITFEKCLSVFDRLGNFSPRFDTECVMDARADALVIAVGQQIDYNTLNPALFDEKTKSLKIDPLTLQTDAYRHIFFSGDIFTGPRSVVDALASGIQVAVSVDRFLNRAGLRWGRDFWPLRKATFIPCGRNKW